MVPTLVQRIFLFVVFIVIGGLFQFWIVIWLKMHDHVGEDVPLERVFADGSLFFYASSLIAGAIFTIQSNPNLFHWTLRYTAVGTGLMVVFFTLLDYKEDAIASLSSMENNLPQAQGRELTELSTHLMRNYRDQILILLMVIAVAGVIELYFELQAKAESKTGSVGSVSLDLETNAGENLKDLSKRDTRSAQQSG
jgi:hypothetical protein